MQEETNSFLKAIEEANKKMQAAEISLEEKDQRIGELDRLIERMEKVGHSVGPIAHLPRLFPVGPSEIREALDMDSSHLQNLQLKKKRQSYKIKYKKVQQSSHFSHDNYFDAFKKYYL